MSHESIMHSIRKFFDVANQSAAAVNRQIIDITQRNLILGLDLAKRLARARDPSEIVRLQTSYWWKQFNEFITQVEEGRKRLFGFGAAELRPTPEPGPGLPEPTRQSLARPQQELSTAAPDPANAKPKQKPDVQKVETPLPAAQSAKRAESEVGRPQPTIQRITAEKRSTRPAGKQGKRKPQATSTTTDQVTRADAPRPKEQSGSQKKRGHLEPAPHELSPQDLPTGVKFWNARW